ncbi:MAG TPA: phosphatase PAP2 family protein [Prolixibacteraceae bacterium]|nr:phosphatase PAP2 family protein [Prolixibacteraceae bacterium]
MNILEGIKQIDQSFLLFLNSFHNSFWDKAVTLFTSTEIWIPFYLLIVYVIIKTYKKNSVYILILIILAITVSDQFSGLIKHSVMRLRPTQDPVLGSLVHNIYNRGGMFGYFSAHAANTFTVAIITARLFKNHLFTVLIFTWAILVSYTRIYLGLHYPGDILTGWIWGILSGLAFYQLMAFIQEKYFKSTFPEIRKTSVSREDSIRLFLFLMIYVGTMLVTINRLTKFQFFNL